ncbi:MULTISPECIES: hypothetical protein [unclassified Ruegeria]|uniref:hypothetical protein n=1 Tax=unclassified Ruegeria TaxID=2625375 RepID=UPI00148897C3|nr:MULTISPECIES: hypothetical protein [unclassified Ruegeria]
MQEEVLATVDASAPRRWIGVVMLVVISVLVIYVALATPPELAWQVFLLVIGGATLWLAQRMWSATADGLELTATELRTRSGRVICRIEDVVSVDRGVFAFKPSNGFLIRVATSEGNAWAPGLWWRLGNRVGVGGVTAASKTKFMSELLTAMLSENE